MFQKWPDSADDRILDVHIDEGKVSPAVLEYLIHQSLSWDKKQFKNVATLMMVVNLLAVLVWSE